MNNQDEYLKTVKAGEKLWFLISIVALVVFILVTASALPAFFTLGHTLLFILVLVTTLAYGRATMLSKVVEIGNRALKAKSDG